MVNVGVGLVLLVAAWLNWRYVERLSMAMWGGGASGQRHARRLARGPFGNKIGGTVFLTMVGLALVVSGLV